MSGSESEDSVDEFYRANPDVPKFSELVKVRNPSPEESALIAAMIKDSRGRLKQERTLPPKRKYPLAAQLDELDASRAGGLRPVGGSGQMDTCVASSHPS
jgi:hypothetical protein